MTYNKKWKNRKLQKWENITKFFWLNMESKKSKITKMKREKIELSFFNLIRNQKSQKLLKWEMKWILSVSIVIKFKFIAWRTEWVSESVRDKASYIEALLLKIMLWSISGNIHISNNLAKYWHQKLATQSIPSWDSSSTWLKSLLLLLTESTAKCSSWYFCTKENSSG